MKKSKIDYDVESDVFSIILSKGYEDDHKEISPGIFVEFDKNGKVIGIEILNASKNIGKFFHGNQNKFHYS